MNFFEALVGNVSVNLCCGDVGVAEHSLHGANVGAIREQISRKRMPKNMRGNFFDDAGEFGGAVNHALNLTRRQ